VDIILDTNAFRIFTENDVHKFIDNVVKKCDHIYVPHDINKELGGRLYSSLNLIRERLRKLDRKYHEESGIENIQLPKFIEENLENNKASELDKKVAKLALKRSKKGNKVYLVSDDRCFINTSVLFERLGIFVKSYEEFKKEYLSGQ